MLEKTVCNYSKFLREYIHGQLSEGCNNVYNRVVNEIGNDVRQDDLLLPICLSSNSAQQFKLKGQRGTIHAAVWLSRFGWTEHGNILQFCFSSDCEFVYGQIARRTRETIPDPCLSDRILTYLNNPRVQKALHANTTHLPYHWGFCAGSVLSHSRLSFSHDILNIGGWLKRNFCRPLEYQIDNLDMNLIPLIEHLIKEGIPILLFRFATLIFSF